MKRPNRIDEKSTGNARLNQSANHPENSPGEVHRPPLTYPDMRSLLPVLKRAAKAIRSTHRDDDSPEIHAEEAKSLASIGRLQRKLKAALSAAGN